jgi:membrane-bound lytic murein transglycosylase D
MTGQHPGFSPPRLHVKVGTRDGARRDLYFERSFRIGRQEGCEVFIPDEYVSRIHAEVILDQGQWWVQDRSSGGIFVHGERIQYAPVSGTLLMRLGADGPLVGLLPEPGVPVAVELRPAGQPAAPPSTLPALQTPQPQVTAQQPLASQPVAKPELSLDEYMQRYFGGAQSDQPAGEHTRMIRLAYQKVQTKQKRKYGRIVAVLVVAVLGAGGYALYLHQQVKKQRAMAQDIFYAMKAMDVNIANVQTLVLDSHNQQGMAEIQRYRAQRQEMEKNYDQFLSKLRVYNAKMTEQERLILRVTRIFGECELAMPANFVAEIQSYIKKWQSSGRLAAAVRTARENGYTAEIAQELLARDLPPQFFYLALQESGFDQYASGPMTRKGIAKGMWQFIPETAVKYGLQIGPLVDLRRPDPGDDRHHYEKETKAATRYLKDLYSSEAQASGFLVMACYNWGEDQVLPLVRSLSANPRERNLWKLLEKYKAKIPQETYDYVFYIGSAAVIGENPRLFGFDFDNPLAHLEKH